MRTGVSLFFTPADIDRIRDLVKNRNTPQKHVSRAQIVLLSAEGLGTNAIMRETAKSKTCVWRWQERFAAEGVDGLLHDKTRPGPSRIPKLDPSIAERVVALTIEAPPGESARRRPQRRRKELDPGARPNAARLAAEEGPGRNHDP
jgi:Winged helix-turn helix